jgi:hypothetical protein
MGWFGAPSAVAECITVSLDIALRLLTPTCSFLSLICRYAQYTSHPSHFVTRSALTVLLSALLLLRSPPHYSLTACCNVKGYRMAWIQHPETQGVSCPKAQERCAFKCHTSECHRCCSHAGDIGHTPCSFCRRCRAAVHLVNLHLVLCALPCVIILLPMPSAPQQRPGPSLSLLRPKCDPHAVVTFCHNVLDGGQISQSLAVCWP